MHSTITYNMLTIEIITAEANQQLADVLKQFENNGITSVTLRKDGIHTKGNWDNFIPYPKGIRFKGYGMLRGLLTNTWKQLI